MTKWHFCILLVDIKIAWLLGKNRLNPEKAHARVVVEPFWPLFDPFFETYRVSLSTMRPGFCLRSPKRPQKSASKRTPKYGPIWASRRLSARIWPHRGGPLFDPFLTPFLRPAESVWARWDLDFAYGALKGLKKDVKIRPLFWPFWGCQTPKMTIFGHFWPCFKTLLLKVHLDCSTISQKGVKIYVPKTAKIGVCDVF